MPIQTSLKYTWSPLQQGFGLGKPSLELWLHPQDFHNTVTKKLWPKLWCGVYTNTLPYDDIFSAMYKHYYWMAPIGGLFCSAKLEL